MNVRVDEENLKSGVLALVVAVVEILHEVMRHQAVRRMEGGTLTDSQSERLGRALSEVEAVIDTLKVEQGIENAVRQLRDGLDGLVDDLVDLERLNAAPLEGVTDDAACAGIGC